jgi:hypothetical protein
MYTGYKEILLCAEIAKIKICTLAEQIIILQDKECSVLRITALFIRFEFPLKQIASHHINEASTLGHDHIPASQICWLLL